MPRFNAIITQRDLSDWLTQLDGPVGVVEERLPALVFAVRELEAQGRAGAGPGRLPDQLHAGLARGATALADVAADAGADDVLPVGLAALPPRGHVVEAQFAG